MPSQWHNEPWRKLYTNRKGDWQRLSVLARGVGSELIKYADDGGLILTLRSDEEAGRAVAALMGARVKEIKPTADAVDELLADGYLVLDGARVLIRNFIDAQSRRSPQAIRQQRWRERHGGSAERGGDNGDVTRGDDVGATGDVTRNATGDVTGDVTRSDQRDVETRRDETRRDETKKPAADPACVRVVESPIKIGDLDKAWWDVTGKPGGDGVQFEALLPMVVRAAEAKGEPPRAFFRRLLPAAVELLNEARLCGRHHGTLTAMELANPKTFARAVDWLDGQRTPEATDEPTRQTVAEALAAARGTP